MCRRWCTSPPLTIAAAAAQAQVAGVDIIAAAFATLAVLEVRALLLRLSVPPLGVQVPLGRCRRAANEAAAAAAAGGGVGSEGVVAQGECAAAGVQAPP